MKNRGSSVLFSKKYIISVIGLAFVLVAGLTAKADQTIKIGVLSKRGDIQCLEQWSPTASYLTAMIPGETFEIVPLDFEAVSPTVEKGLVDFIFTNSAMYVELEIRFGVNRIATLKNKRVNGTFTEFGGIIFCLKNRPDIRKLTDLTGTGF